jgi:hypothetical protein
MEKISLNETALVTEHALRAQTRNVDFIEICFTGRTDFIVVRYSVANKSTKQQSISFPRQRSQSQLNETVYCKVFVSIFMGIHQS